MERKFGAITSSTNPEEIAMRVKGIVVALSSIIILIAAQIFHIQLTASDVLSLGTELGAIAGAITVLYGAGMWVLTLVFKQKSTEPAQQ